MNYGPASTQRPVEEVEEPLGGDGSGHRLAVPGGSLGLGEAEEFLHAGQHVVEAALLTGKYLSSSGSAMSIGVVICAASSGVIR
jgi:hypothetical protein